MRTVETSVLEFKTSWASDLLGQNVHCCNRAPGDPAQVQI